MKLMVKNPDDKESNTVDFEILIPAPEFIRGDGNGDGFVDLSDGIAVVFHLFLGGLLPCEDAADTDDDEDLQLDDAIGIFDFLYRNGPQPGAPFPRRGPDPSGVGGALDCDL